MAQAKFDFKWLLPDLSDLVFLGIFYLLFFLKPTFLFSDGSVGWQITTGNYIIDSHTIPHQDIFTYTFPTRAWVDPEWFAHIIIAGLVRLGGLNLLAIISGSIIASLFFFLCQRCRKEGTHFLLVLVLVLIGELACAIHWLARPLLVTLVGVYLFYVTCEDFYRGTITLRRLLLIVLPFTLLWVNSHPGFPCGLAIITIYFVSALLEKVIYEQPPDSRPSASDRLKGFGLCLTLTLLITLANPYSFGIITYLSNYLQRRELMDVSLEFQSPIFHGAIHSACLEVLFALVVVGLALNRNRLTLPSLLLTLAFAHLSLVSVRNIPLFVLIAVPTISRLFSKAHYLTQDQVTLPALKPSLRSLATAFFALDQRFSEMESRCKTHFWPLVSAVALCAVAIGGGSLFGFKILRADFDQKLLPGATLASIKRLNLDPHRGLNYDNWGGYINYKLGIPVFIDDRAPFYPTAFCAEYLLFNETMRGWDKLLDKYNIGWVLFPTDSNPVRALRERPDWKLVDQDKCSSLFVRLGESNKGK